MTNQTQFPSRMHNLKEQLQRVTEMELSAARQSLEQLETKVASIHRSWQAALAGPVNEKVVDMQYRSMYAAALHRQLEGQRQLAVEAADEVRQRLQAVKVANVATEQWAHLSETAKMQVVKAVEHHHQIEADDLAAGRYAISQGGERQ